MIQISHKFRPRIHVAAALLLAISLGCAGASTPPNVLVLVVDTLRADRLSCYGNERPTSPTLDSLAAQGILFENAISAAPRTWQSFATILTGVYPPRHGVRFIFDDPIPAELPTLASILDGLGYRSAAFDGIRFLRGIMGGRGFGEFIDSQSQGRPLHDRDVIDLLLNWLDSSPKPFFAFVRLKGPHWPYESRQDHHDLFGNDEGVDHSFNRGTYGLRPSQERGGVGLQSNRHQRAHFLRDSFQYLIAATPLFPGFLVFSDQASLA